jgi:acyl-CoA dehydrogenase
MDLALVLLLAGLGLALLWERHAYLAWVVPGGAALAVWPFLAAPVNAKWGLAALAYAALAILFGVRSLRLRLVSPVAMRLVAPMLPRMSGTERIALEAGTVWWDGDLFSGDPDWRKLLNFPVHHLSSEERSFLDGPITDLCARLDEWQIGQARDLPPAVWDLLKRHGLFGMIIPKEFGGLGFSAIAHSAVVVKLAGRSLTAAVTAMVPNSLGPGELLLHYGTDAQKRYWLPRLASGEEIPCFALTGPEAGSDAAATQSTGIVCRGSFRGEEVLGLRLSWRKRYITLAPVATVIGLAFRLRDPDGLLGGEEDLGITCALVPADLPGIEIGLRHDPMGVPFQNGPIVGRDVFVPLEAIIGGREGAGQGWRMLMESLAAGRGISLPSLAVGAAQLATRVVGAYATVREQFDTPIGRFEGIEEPLARIGGFTYGMDAARLLTCGAIDAGERPAVLSAIVKAYLTEAMRTVVNDAMDVRAGAAIMRGPRNILARAHAAVPIGITVEGANILTRSMIIYGQGVIRCHPYAREEIEAAAAADTARFDRAFFGHLAHVARNAARALVLGLGAGSLGRAGERGHVGELVAAFTRMSAAFALVSDAAMVTLGGSLKRREKITGRLADALAWLYLGSAALKRFHDEGRRTRDLPFLRWSCEYALQQIQNALDGVLVNLPNRPAAWALRPLVFPLGRRLRGPDDALGATVARELLEDRAARQELTRDIYVPTPGEAGLGRLEAALEHAVEALPVEAKLRDAVRRGSLDRAPGEELADAALAAGVIDAAEREKLRAADAARDEAIAVDAWDAGAFRALRS